MKKVIILLFMLCLFFFLHFAFIPTVVNAATTISTVSMIGATAPDVGKTPDFSVGVTSNTHAVVKQVSWWNPTEQLGENDRFVSDNDYTMVVYLMPENGYAFDTPESMTVSINGVSGYTVAVEAYGGETKPGRAIYCYFPTTSGLATPKLTGAESTKDGILVTWETVVGAEKYRVYRKTGSSGWMNMAETSSPNYTDKAVTYGTTYTYTVRCVDANGNYTSKFDEAGKTIQYLATPVLTGISNANGGVKLTWGKVTGAAKYRVFRKKGTSGWSAYANVTGTSYTDIYAVSGTTYTYTVRCIDANGNYASWFDEAGKTIRYISTPVLTGISNVSEGVKQIGRAHV